MLLICHENIFRNINQNDLMSVCDYCRFPFSRPAVSEKGCKPCEERTGNQQNRAFYALTILEQNV